MNLFTEIDQVDSVLSADGWRPARRAENSMTDRRNRSRRQEQGEKQICHLSFHICHLLLIPSRSEVRATRVVDIDSARV